VQIERAALGGRGIGSAQKLVCQVGVLETPDGIQSRRHAEADGLFVCIGRVCVTGAQQGAQAWALGALERAQPAAHEGAVLARQWHAVGDGGYGFQLVG